LRKRRQSTRSLLGFDARGRAGRIAQARQVNRIPQQLANIVWQGWQREAITSKTEDDDKLAKRRCRRES
jgi:hypothetical protein